MSLRDTVNELCLNRLGREPNLDNPKGFNDLIQWLKIHDQRQEHITACDKWAVRKMVPAENRVPATIDKPPNEFPAVLKCSHDCGSFRVAERRKDYTEVYAELRGFLEKPYGIEKGEWAYKFIRPRIVTEILLERGITDYKFHCSHGKIRWVQVISERGHEDGPKETILTPTGAVLGLHMDQNMRHVTEPAYPGDEAWEALTALARKLAKPWRYVRVDLYWSRRWAWFGEMTFWPLAGCYLTDDEPTFGAMLELDLTHKFKPIVS